MKIKESIQKVIDRKYLDIALIKIKAEKIVISGSGRRARADRRYFPELLTEENRKQINEIYEEIKELEEFLEWV